MQNNTVGQRLKGERVRLGLSQEDFGKIGGVKKLAQLNYEKDLRAPPYKYFDSLRENEHIDVEYILTGLKSKERDLMLNVVTSINYTIAMALDLGLHAFSRAIDDTYQQEVVANDTEGNLPAEAYLVKNVAIENEVYRTVEESPKIIDYRILEDLFVQFDIALTKSNLKIPSEKKAAILIVLYRTFKASGKIDINTIEDVIKLASI